LEHLQKVADVYQRAWVERKNPTEAVKDAFQVSYSTASKWVMRAREARLLPGTTRGVPAVYKRKGGKR
jgi:transposase